MKLLDYVILTLVALVLFFVIRHQVRRKASGACGCGGCAGCSARENCAERK